MMLFASANRDDRVFEQPDDFDITRDPRHHLGFGSGIHMCVGQHLAQMEMMALVEAMIPRVKTIEVGEPVVAMNNTIYGFASLPTVFSPGPSPASLIRRLSSASAQTADEKLLRGRIAARAQVAQNIVALEIEPEEGCFFPTWTPGAHVDIVVHDGLIRQYSLTGPLTAGRYQVAVRLEPKSRGGSRALHAHFRPGANIVLSRPRNHFPLSESPASSALFSGGIGITPILAMAWRLHELGRAFVWHLSSRSRERLAWADQIDQLPFRDVIRLHIGDIDSSDRLQASEVLMALPPSAHIYVCGSRSYMDDVVLAAQQAGFGPSQVHLEHFGAEIDVDGDPFMVVAARSGNASPSPRTSLLLAALQREGFDIPTSCRNGVCGTGLTTVIEGRPDHRDLVLTEAEKAEGDRIAVCCSRSRSAVLVLDI